MLDLMSQTLYERVEAERERRNLSPIQVARFFGTTKQAYNNWRHRGIPTQRYGRVADFLRCTVDEVLGRVEHRAAKDSVAESTMLYGYGVTQEGAQLAAEWQKLDAPTRASIRELIEVLVANQRKAERAERPKGAHRRASATSTN